MVEKLAKELVFVGALKGPHGLKGLVKANIGLDDPDLLVKAGPLMAEDGRAWRVLRWQTAGQGLLALALEGVDSIEKADILKGLRVYLDRTAWPAAPKDEVYVRDLVGRTLMTASGVPQGVVVSVAEMPAGTCVGVACAHDGKERLVPVQPAFVSVHGDTMELTELGEELLRL